MRTGRILLSFILLVLLHSTACHSQTYYPEGTNWVELRLDTTRYNTWYTVVQDGESTHATPNFEEAHYYVKGDTVDEAGICYKNVWLKMQNGSDSLQFLLRELEEFVLLSGMEPTEDTFIISCPAEVYLFDWKVGTSLVYVDLHTAQLTGYFGDLPTYGTITEIEEKSFGGCKPLKYIDTQDGRTLIQGIGVTSWNDYYCIFGPARVNDWVVGFYPFDVRKDIQKKISNYKSILVHFERDGEVLYDMWPSEVNDLTHRVGSTNNTPFTTPLYDLQGRQLQQKPSKGMYIQGGHIYKQQ